MMSSRRLASSLVMAGAAVGTMASAPASANAQWSTAYEQMYLPGDFNWTFREQYAVADRLFAAFDYGHAILYERLYNDPDADASVLEEKEFNFITKKLLVSPPRLPLEEAAIEVQYAKMAPEAKLMFDWAHLLHRQIYDVLADERMMQSDKDAKIAELVDYYKTRPDLAFSSVPKNMELMEGQPYSLAFRQRYQKFNGLIWGYHWLQVGLYEPLMVGKTQEERQAGVLASVSRFKQMLEGAPEHLPRIMPMTAAIAPTFAKRYQEAAIVFDNLHAMHDVVSDILTSDRVPRDGKRAAILEAGRRYRDATSFTMSLAEWASMGESMGIENMGGPAVGMLPGWQTPTLARGASMLDAMKDMHGMAGMTHRAKPDTGVMMHGAKADRSGTKMTDSSSARAMQQGDMAGMPMAGHDSSAMRYLHLRMMADPVIHERIMADTLMRRMMMEMPGMGAVQHDVPGMEMQHPTSKRSTTKRAAPATKPVTKPKPPAKVQPMDVNGMKGMKMPGMKP